MVIQVIPVEGLPLVKAGDDLPQLIVDALRNLGSPLLAGDIIVLTHKVVSKAEGRIVNLKGVNPSEVALNFANLTYKDPRLVEVVLRESRAVRRMAPGVLITETKQGFVCANSGVDKSNVEGVDVIAILPEDPDSSADSIRARLLKLTGFDIPIIISDTHGRAHRDGEVNMAIGTSGLKVIRDRRGESDLFGYELKVKRIAVVDEIAAAGELVIGQANEGVPCAVIRGYVYQRDEEARTSDLVWPRDKDLFP
jgi:coenzyme F420-0:L-glutamate ligase/coenzyme F420-1:gamma-L-glutamate ligase